MPSTLIIPATLPRTVDEVRSRLRSELGTVGIPNLHWPLATGEDCLGFLTWAAGIRDRDDLTTALIRISAFRASAGWHEVRTAGEIRAGDWVLWDWDEIDDPDHAEFVYSVDRAHDEITTISANTGPRPGVDITKHPDLRGVYQKTRPLSSPEIWGALRPAYRQPVVTSSEIKSVRAAGSYLNRTMPGTYRDTVTGRLIVLHRTGAGDIGSAKGDGKRGPLYRLLVQAWGATHDEHGRKVEDRARAVYGPTYKLDGIFGRRSDYVEGRLWAAVKAAR
jgi:hypothetical protein